MDEQAWRSLLQEWSDGWLQVESRQWPAAVRKKRWLGYPPAGDAQIRSMERRLGVEVPPSYRSFLKVTNGWRNTTTFIERLLPTSDVNWFAAEHPHWVDAYSKGPSPGMSPREYFSYSARASGGFEPEQIEHTLQVSSVGDSAVVLLNPDAVTEDGEWEAWFLANWNPGVVRYPSFWELMRHDLASFRRLELKQNADVCGGPYAGAAAPARPRRPAERDWKKFRRSCENLESLVAQLESGSTKDRRQAAKRLYGHVRLRWEGHRRPDLQPVFIRIAEESPDAHLRHVAVSLLTTFGEDDPTRQVLLNRLDDPDENTAAAAAYGLFWLADEQAVEPVCRLLERASHAWTITSVCSVLGRLGDTRAIPFLEAALSRAQNLEAGSERVGIALTLANFGNEGLQALIRAASSAMPEVRFAAVCALDQFPGAEAHAALEKATMDSDEKTGERAKLAIRGHDRGVAGGVIDV